MLLNSALAPFNPFESCLQEANLSLMVSKPTGGPESTVSHWVTHGADFVGFSDKEGCSQV